MIYIIKIRSISANKEQIHTHMCIRYNVLGTLRFDRQHTEVTRAAIFFFLESDDVVKISGSVAFPENVCAPWTAAGFL